MLSLNLRINFSLLTTFVIVWSFLGYQAIASMVAVFDLPGTEISIFFRFLVVLLSVYLLTKSSFTGLRLVILVYIIFWMFYFLRLYVSLHILDEQVSRSSSIYWVWAVGVSFVPGLAVLLHAKRLDIQNLGLSLINATAIVAIIIFIVTVLLSSIVMSEDTYSYRLGFESLNPILIGHVGASATICGLFGFVSYRKSLIKIILFSFLSAIGAYLVVSANSRGPIVSLIGVFGLFFVVRSFSGRSVVSSLVVLAGFITAVYVMRDKLFEFGGVVSRFVSISGGYDLSADIRVVALSGAINQFLSSPFVGSSIEEKITSYYPHNVIVEAFMATGLIGGLLFMSLFLAAATVCLKFLLRESFYPLIAMLALQYMLAGQFSGALYSSGSMWIFICLILGINPRFLRDGLKLDSSIATRPPLTSCRT